MGSLRELKEGEKGVIIKIRGRGEFRKRITEMGFIGGKWVTVVKKAPLQDPVEYYIMDSHVSLRRSEANLIEVLTQEEASHLVKSQSFNGVLHNKLQKRHLREKSNTIEIALVGNPNSGKTTLFNFASHSREHVGNYAGVTVDSKTAILKIKGYIIKLTDLPGTYSLSCYSPEELYVRNHLFDTLPDIVINVLDASNLERNLYLTTQLIDMDCKVIVALNMYDEMILKGDTFDYKKLGEMLGIPILPTIASKGKGVKELFQKVIDLYEDKKVLTRKIDINYGMDIEQSLGLITEKLKKIPALSDHIPLRYYAVKLLEQDSETLSSLSKLDNFPQARNIALKEVQKLESLLNEDTETLIANAKYGFIEGALKETYVSVTNKKRSFSQYIDTMLTGKFLGYPIFIGLMWLMFEATFVFGDVAVQGIEYLVSLAGSAIQAVLPDSIFKDMLIDGIIGGVGGVIVFLPNILILFFFITIMEDTGYMARVAFMVDKLMHKVGLHGKSFIPLLMGFGCNVPAIMATRTIENRSDRMVTMLITPFMSCSARYPVYVLLISAFFTQMKGTILFSLYIIGILLAGLIAFIFKKTIFRSQDSPFVMELPPYRAPTVKAILRHTWFKGEQYLKKMGTVILLASLIIWALGYFPQNHQENLRYQNLIGQAENNYDTKIEQAGIGQLSVIKELNIEKDKAMHHLQMMMKQKHQEQSFIGRIGHFIEPVIRPLGFDWKMGVSLVAGSAAKEVVVSTMGVLYQADPDSQENTGLISKLVGQKYENGPRKGEQVFTALSAFSFMIFVLIYFPCIAVIAAIRKESGKWKWSAFTATYTTLLAWIMAFITFQGGSLIVSLFS